MIRKPAVIQYWLLSARRAQVALLIVILTVPTVLPGAMDRALEALHPPVTTPRLLGLWEKVTPDPRLEERQALARVLLWVGAAALVLGLLWVQIPAAVAQTRQRARELETEADSLRSSDPTRSVELYGTALRFESDRDRESALSAKLTHVGRQLGLPVSGGAPPSTDFSTTDRDAGTPQATVVMSETEHLGLPVTIVGHEARYRLQRELGRGAMGVVYRGLDTRLERPVALKQLFAHRSGDPELVRRFRQEAKVLARLSHPGIVQVYDFFEEESGAWIAMELVEGEDLDHRLVDGALPAADVVRIGIELANALGYAHEQGVVHRDFKPGNVLIDAEGRCKISDFGIAKFAESSVHTQAGMILGSPAYMSPEQAKGDAVDARADIYALGVTLYRMAAGRLPFQGDARSVLAQVLTQSPPPPCEVEPGVPAAFSELILRMMAKDPNRRPSTAAEVVQALSAMRPID